MANSWDHRVNQAVIYLDRLRHNIAYLKGRMSPGQRLYGVVKANAYGHGILEISQAALAYGVQGLMVATVDEGIQLRQAGIREAEIIVLGLTDPRGIAEVLAYDLTLTVAQGDFFARAWDQLESMGQTALLEDQPLKVHLKIDTGMGRIGLRKGEEIQVFAQQVAACSWVQWLGAFTHFATAAGGDPAYMDLQWDRWLQLQAFLPDSVTDRHYSNSAMGLWQQRVPYSTIFRAGIAMYGYDPKDQLMAGMAQAYHLDNGLPVNGQDELQPILEWQAEISYVKQVQRGDWISYGSSYQAQEDQWIATVSVGYGDGWFRHYGGFPLLVDGQACPIVGVVNMDQMMVRLPGYYPPGTPVTLLGRSGDCYNHASVLAQEAGTISYEILTAISPRVQRIYID